MAGEEISFTVLVKEVKAKKLPPLDDELAKTIGEFESLNALKEDLRERLVGVKRELVGDQIRGLVLEELVNTAQLDPPDKLVSDEFQHRLEHLNEELNRAGLTIADYASRAQSTELEIRSDLRSQAERSVKAELLLEEIARRQELEVNEEDVGREIALAAAQTQRDPKDVAQELADSVRLRAVAADIMRRKALDYVVANANVAGRPPEEDNPLQEDISE
jgi:trigger factor